MSRIASKMNQQRAEDCIRILGNRRTQREAEITNRASAALDSSDDDLDSDHLIFDSFYSSGGSGAIARMINFTPSEFRQVYSLLETHINNNWNVGRGRKYSCTPMDVFFMVLAVLKHGGS